MFRYIGGCCGFEPYHIRAVSEELCKERGGKVSDGSQKHDVWGGGLRMHTKPWVRARARKEYWANLNPAPGRPFSATMSKPDAWGVTKGDNLLQQQADATTEDQMKKVFDHKKNGNDSANR